MGSTVSGAADTAVMTRPSRATSSGRAYLDLLARARREERSADELLTLYVLERLPGCPLGPIANARSSQARVASGSNRITIVIR